MKPENIDALLLDRALGELSPEVQELLAEHLGRDPQAATRAAVFAETAALARTALADRHRPVPRADSPLPRRRWFRFRGEALRLAACFVLGGLGVWCVEHGVSRPAAAVVARAPLPPSPPRPEPMGASPGFWSVPVVNEATRSTAGRGQRPYRLRWDTPGRMPHLEENP